jgi:hypothetical protein
MVPSSPAGDTLSLACFLAGGHTGAARTGKEDLTSLAFSYTAAMRSTEKLGVPGISRWIFLAVLDAADLPPPLDWGRAPDPPTREGERVAEGWRAAVPDEHCSYSLQGRGERG